MNNSLVDINNRLLPFKAIFYLTPLLDSITGYFVLNGIISEASIFSPSQLGKIIIVLYVLLELYKKSGLKFYSVILLIGYISTLEIICYLYFGTTLYAYMVGFVQLFKLCYIISIYFYTKNLVDSDILNYEKLILILKNSALIYSLILIITTILGINTQTYGSETFGTKGVFASGNGLSLYLGVFSSIALFDSIKKKSLKSKIIFSIIFMSCILVGTKASIVFLIFNLVIIFKFSPKLIKFIMVAGLIFSIYYLRDIFLMVFDVIIHRYKNSSSLKAFLASGRDNYINGAFEKYKVDNLLSLRIFFGAGSFVSFRSSLVDMKGFDTLENDFFDIFFMYGVNGLIIYLGFLVKYVISFIKRKNYFLTMIFILVYGYSNIAGHVVFNAMSGLTLVLVPIIQITYNKGVPK